MRRRRASSRLGAGSTSPRGAPPTIRAGWRPTGFERVWSPARRARVDCAIRGSGKSFAIAAAGPVEDGLDRWAGEWRFAREATCRESGGGGRGQAAGACLEGQLAIADARIALLEQASVHVLARAGRIATLPAPRECRRAAGLVAAAPDPAASAGRAAARKAAAAAEAAAELGHHAEARRLLAAVAPTLDQLGDPHLADQVRFDLANEERSLHHGAVAEKLVQEVAESASARGDDALAARSWNVLLAIKGDRKAGDGLDYVITADRAAARRVGLPETEVKARLAIGRALLATDRLAEGAAACEDARKLADANPDLPAHRRQMVWSCLALAATFQGHQHQALDFVDRAFALHVAEVGPGNPQLAADLRNLGEMHMQIGQIDSATVLAWTAYQLTIDAYGERSDDGVAATNTLSKVLALSPRAADRRRALDLADRGVAAADAVYGHDHVEAVEMRISHAHVRKLAGDRDGARVEWDALWPELVARHDLPGQALVVAANTYASLLPNERCADRIQNPRRGAPPREGAPRRAARRDPAPARDLPPLAGLPDGGPRRAGAPGPADPARGRRRRRRRRRAGAGRRRDRGRRQGQGPAPPRPRPRDLRGDARPGAARGGRGPRAPRPLSDGDDPTVVAEAGACEPRAVARRGTDGRDETLSARRSGLTILDPASGSPGDAEPAPAPPRPGDWVGRYRIERRLGAGGMGVVLEALDPELDRRVALKLVRRDIGDPAHRERLIREARAMAQLEHVNVVRVYDAGEHDGEVFVAMELVRGETMGQWLRARPRPWRAVLDRFLAVGRGLAAAHAAGLVHRDFKPDNVLVRDSDGRVCVTDFGLAVSAGGAGAAGDGVAAGEGGAAGDGVAAGEGRGDDRAAGGGATGEADAGVEPTLDLRGGRSPTPRPAVAAATPATASLTATGALVGTPPYMAPEQHRGAEVDPRADVFSFCVSLYEGLYGERPFAVERGPGVDAARAWGRAIQTGRVRPPPAGRRVPGAVRRAVVRGLAVDPDERWPSMAPLLRALERARHRRRRRVLVAAGLAAVGAAAAGLLIVSHRAAADPCRLAAARVDDVWSPARRARVGAALRASGKPYAIAAVAPVDARIDRWAGEWRRVREATCRRGGDERRVRAADACLEGVLAAADARIALLESPTSDAQIHANALAELPEARTCERSAGLGEDTADPATAAARTAAWKERANADAALVLGHQDDARRRLDALLTRVETLGSPVLVDAVRISLADAERQLNHGAVAEKLAQEVAEHASARGDDTWAAHAWNLLLTVKGDRNDGDGLDYIVTAARSAASRVGLPVADVRAQVAIGNALIEAGKLDAGTAACDRARAVLTANPELPADLRVKVWNCAALAASHHGRTGDALDLVGRAFAAQLADVGPGNPQLAGTLRNLAIMHNRLGHVGAATALKWTAYQMTIDAYGERSLDGVRAQSSLVQALVQSRDPTDRKEALHLADRSLANAEAIYGADDGHVLSLRSVHAQARQHAGDPAGALAEYAALWPELSARDDVPPYTVIATANNYASLMGDDRCAEALPILGTALTRARGMPAPRVAGLIPQHAGCLRLLGRPAEAAAELEPLAAALQPEQVGPMTVAAVELELGADLLEAGQKARARPHVERARGLFQAAHVAAGVAEADKVLRRLR